MTYGSTVFIEIVCKTPVFILQGVLNIQNHYSATMHYSTPKTGPEKGPIHKTDWTCSKVNEAFQGWPVRLVCLRSGREGGVLLSP
jgi:hypothetical protein